MCRHRVVVVVVSIIVIVVSMTIALHASVSIDFSIIGGHRSCAISHTLVMCSRSGGAEARSLMPMRWHLDEAVLS